MASDYRKPGPLPPIYDFEERFRRAFGREMTSDERRFFKLASLLLDEETDLLEERSKGTAA